MNKMSDHTGRKLSIALCFFILYACCGMELKLGRSITYPPFYNGFQTQRYEKTRYSAASQNSHQTRPRRRSVTEKRCSIIDFPIERPYRKKNEEAVMRKRKKENKEKKQETIKVVTRRSYPSPS